MWLSCHEKLNYEINNPINWKNGKCCICNFLLDVTVKGPNAGAKEMSSFDLFNRKEHKFIRNVLDEDDLKKSNALKFYARTTKCL